MNWRTGSSGGSGAAWRGQVLLTGNFDWWVGNPGTGYGDGAAAGFKETGGADIIVAGGGKSGSSRTGGILQTDWGSPSVVVQQTSVARNGNNGHYQSMGSGVLSTAPAVSAYDGTASGYGASSGVYTWNHDYTGVQGAFIMDLIFEPIRMIGEASRDGVTWDIFLEMTLGESGKSSRQIDLPAGYTRFRLRIDDETDYAYQSRVGFQYIRVMDATDEETAPVARLEKFIFNTSEKYLFVLSDEMIVIYQDDQIVGRVEATGLKAAYIPELRVAVREDTMILCHADMVPKQLQRKIADGSVQWEWTDFELKNMPYYAFSGETEEKKTVGITPSGMEGGLSITADSDIFTEDMVGQYIDGNGGRFRISEYKSAKKVSGYTQIPFYTEDKISEWTLISGYEPAWSEERGWPKNPLFAGERLWFGGSKSRPCTLFASRVNLFNDFKNAGNYDNDSIVADLLTVHPIVNIVYNRGIHVLTGGEEWTVGENAFSPNNFAASINTQNGSWPLLRPVVIGGIVLFIEKNGRSLLSYVYDYNQSSYITEDISLLSDLIHAPVSMDVEINSARDKGDFLYIVLPDGSMLVDTISLSQDVRALSRLTTDGKIKSVCSVGEETYLLVVRGGMTLLEKISDVLTDCQMDMYIASDHSEETGTVVKGLYQYAGKTVRVWSDNRDYGEYAVDGLGQFRMDYVPNETCHIGIPFDCKMVSNPISINGMSSSIHKRISRAVVVATDTERVQMNGVSAQMSSGGTFLFYAVTGYQRDCRYEINSRFKPVTILSITLFINYGR